LNKAVNFPLDAMHADGVKLNTRPEPNCQRLNSAPNTARAVLRGGVGTAATALLGGWSLTACGGGGDDDVPAPAPVAALSFGAVAKSTADKVTVPVGYTATAIYALGDPLTAATPAFRNDGTDTDYANRAGDHRDVTSIHPSFPPRRSSEL
jgi:secreted PhoX family phosphatase